VAFGDRFLVPLILFLEEMAMLMVLRAVALCSSLQGDPLEAFRGNLQATECAMEFTCDVGVGLSAELCAGRAWKAPHITTIRQHRVRCASGRWETDGSTERCVMRLPEDVLAQRAAENKAGLRESTILDPAEFITDGDLVAFHELDKRHVDVYPALSNSFHLTAYKGPYSWWRQKFPDVLDEKWKDAERAYADGHHGTFATRDMILTKSLTENEYSMVIAFDPSFGFIPRYARRSIYYRSRDTASIAELWMLSATRTSSGGFVPTAWIETGFWIESFRAKYATFGPEAVFECPSTEVEFTHFSVSNVEDRKPELAIVCEGGFSSLISTGGVVSLSNHPSTLTLRDVRNLLGLKPYVAPRIPQIATAEVGQFNRTRSSVWKYLLAVFSIAFGCILLGYGYRRFRSTSLLLVIATLMATGCAKPEPDLQASFKDEHVLFNADDPDPTLPLVVRNTGNCDIEIQKLEGQCVCTLVGKTPFPLKLKPAEQVQAHVRIQKRYDFKPQQLAWTFETDKGKLQCKSSVFMLPAARISPFSRNFQSLELGQVERFEIVSHLIWKEEDAQPSGVVVVSENLHVEEKAKRSGKGPVLGYEFEEVTYAITIEDSTSLGQHREEIKLQAIHGQTLASGLVLWQRVAHVSVVPESVYLSDNKVRLFLRCRDDNVELVRVVQVPEGINAILTSPRELSVWPKPDAAQKVVGEIIVETNASRDAVIRIPLNRSSPDRAPGGQ